MVVRNCVPDVFSFLNHFQDIHNLFFRELAFPCIPSLLIIFKLKLFSILNIDGLVQTGIFFFFFFKCDYKIIIKLISNLSWNVVYVNNILQKLNLFYVYEKKTLHEIRSIKICKNKKLKNLYKFFFFFRMVGILLPCYRKDHHHILKRIRNLDR